MNEIYASFFQGSAACPLHRAGERIAERSAGRDRSHRDRDERRRQSGNRYLGDTSPDAATISWRSLRQTGALLDGHFVLRSGLHSRQFFQCALLLQHTDIAAEVCGRLADKLRDIALRRGYFSGARWNRGRAGSRSRAREAPHLRGERGGRSGPAARLSRSRLTNVLSSRKTWSPAADASRKRSTSSAHAGASWRRSAVIVDRSGGQRPDFGCPFVSLSK